MIKVLHYQIVNGEKSDMIPFRKILENEKELDKLRSYLEEKEHCWIENKTITGIDKKKIKDIMLTYEIR